MIFDVVVSSGPGVGDRCQVSDGQERCCLQHEHAGPHMGRWYTMSPTAIEKYRAEVEKYRALGKSK